MTLIKYERFRLTEQECKWIDDKQLLKFFVVWGSKGDYISKIVLLGADETWYYAMQYKESDNTEWAFNDTIPRYVSNDQIKMIRRDIVVEIAEIK